MIQQGDIAFSGKAKWSFYSRGVMWFTKSRWSHCFFLLGDVCGHLSVLESELNVQTVPFEREYIQKQVDYYEIYRLTAASQEDLQRAAKESYHLMSGQMYGFLQIPWFMYRAAMKRWFGLDRHKNWSTGGVICSELLYNYIYAVGGEYRELLKDFGPDNVSPQDLYDIALARPDLFQFITKREIDAA